MSRIATRPAVPIAPRLGSTAPLKSDGKDSPRVLRTFRLCLFPNEKWMRARFAEERVDQAALRDEFGLVVARDLWPAYRTWRDKETRRERRPMRAALDTTRAVTRMSDSRCFNAVCSGLLQRDERCELWTTMAQAHLRSRVPVNVMSRDAEGRISSTMDDQIQMDTFRTFPDLAGYNPRLLVRLNRLLRAYVHWRPERGYTQGMNYVAMSILTFVSDDSLAFWTFVHICDTVLLNYFMPGLHGVVADSAVLAYYVRRRLPHVHKHLTECGVSLELLVSPWFSTLFVQAMPSTTAFRVIDQVMLRGCVVLFELTLGIFEHYYDKSVLALTDMVDIINALNNRVRATFDLEPLMQRQKPIEPAALTLRRTMAVRRVMKRTNAAVETSYPERWQLPDTTDDDTERVTDAVCVGVDGGISIVPIGNSTRHTTTASDDDGTSLPTARAAPADSNSADETSDDEIVRRCDSEASND